jgi:hypothetical protein
MAGALSADWDCTGAKQRKESAKPIESQFFINHLQETLAANLADLSSFWPINLNFLSLEDAGASWHKYGPWAGGQFANMVKRHMVYKKKYPDRPPTYGMPYEAIEGLWPETQELLRIFALGRPTK